MIFSTMSAANFEEIKKRYNFKQVSVATWRDPWNSVLPTRGGPKAAAISPEAAARPYVPTYKVSYTKPAKAPEPPEPTDDEDSEDEDEKEDELVEEVKVVPEEGAPEAEGTASQR